MANKHNIEELNNIPLEVYRIEAILSFREIIIKSAKMLEARER